MAEQPFIEIEHPADLALRVWGRDLPSLFTHAAQGMFHLMRYGPSPVEATPMTHDIALEADDLETLLVDWLGELLYLADREAAHLGRFEVVSLEQATLRALAHGEAPRYPGRSIKAVTYADLAIRPVAGGYETIVTFDV
jgi:SHS2 domain-containing protein